MSILRTDGTDAAESELLSNWAAKYAQMALDNHKTETPIDHPDGSVTTPKIGDGAVTEKKIGSAAVTSPKLDDGAVTTDKLDDYCVTQMKLAQGAVSNNRLQNDSVDSRVLAANSVETEHIKNGNVTTDKLSDTCVTNQKIANGAVKEQNVSDKAITTDKIADYAVGQQQLAQAAVSNNRIQSGAVDERCVQDSSITPAKLSQKYAVNRTDITSAPTSSDVSYTQDIDIVNINTASGGAKTERDYYMCVKINEGPHQTFEWGKLVFDKNLQSIIDDLNITIQQNIKDESITSEKLADYSVTQNKLAQACVSNNRIQSGAVDTRCLEDNSVTGDKINDGTITAAKLAPGVLPPSNYSTTPQKIGTWIDGTPIWRLAFDRQITPNASNDINIVIAKSDDNVRIIDRKAYVTLDHNVVDTGKVADSDVDATDLLWSNIGSGTMCIQKKNTGSPENYVYGYIDYATPESNLPE